MRYKLPLLVLGGLLALTSLPKDSDAGLSIVRYEEPKNLERTTLNNGVVDKYTKLAEDGSGPEYESITVYDRDRTPLVRKEIWYRDGVVIRSSLSRYDKKGKLEEELEDIDGDGEIDSGTRYGVLGMTVKQFSHE